VVGFLAVADGLAAAGFAGAANGASPGGGGSWKIDRKPPPLGAGATGLAPLPAPGLGVAFAGGFAAVFPLTGLAGPALPSPGLAFAGGLFAGLAAGPASSSSGSSGAASSSSSASGR